MSDLIDRQPVAKDINVPCTDTISRQPEITKRTAETEQNVPNDELISRKAANEWCFDCKEYDQERHCCPRFNRVIRETLDEVKSQTTVQERKGRWVDCVGSDHWKCSECGDRAPMYWDSNRQEYDEWFSPYCPNCGASMTEGAEE